VIHVAVRRHERLEAPDAERPRRGRDDPFAHVEPRASTEPPASTSSARPPGSLISVASPCPTSIAATTSRRRPGPELHGGAMSIQAAAPDPTMATAARARGTRTERRATEAGTRSTPRGTRSRSQPTMAAERARAT